MSPTGESVTYVAGSTPIPVPHTDDLRYRKPHQPRPPKPTGLDWDALKRPCTMCGQRSSELVEDQCPRCRKVITQAIAPDVVVTPYADSYRVLDTDDVDTRFTAPARPTQAPSDPVENRQPPTPTPAPLVRAKVRQVSPDDIHITLRGPGLAHRQTEIAALLDNLLHHIQTPGAGVNATNPGPHEPAVGPKAVKDTGPTFLDPDRPAPAPAPTSGGGDRKGKPAPPPDTRRPRATRTHPDITTIRHRYLEQQHTTTHIANDLGCAVSTIRRALLNDGITLRDDRARNHGHNHRTWTPEQIHDLTTRYQAGETTIELGAAYKARPDHIAKVLRTNGVTIRRPRSVGKPITDTDIDRMVQLYVDQGKGLPTVAKTIGISKARTREALLARGVQLRPSHGPGIKHATRTRTADIRGWAIQQGLLTPEQTRGRFPNTVREAYAAAHPTEENAS